MALDQGYGSVRASCGVVVWRRGNRHFHAHSATANSSASLITVPPCTQHRASVLSLIKPSLRPSPYRQHSSSPAGVTSGMLGSRADMGGSFAQAFTACAQQLRAGTSPPLTGRDDMFCAIFAGFGGIKCRSARLAAKAARLDGVGMSLRRRALNEKEAEGSSRKCRSRRCYRR